MSEKQSVDSIFCSAIEIESSEERKAFLREACADDSELLRQLDRLLDAHFHGGSILDSPAHGLGATIDQSIIDQPITEKTGTQIGPYKLLQKLDEGGMGVVYLAEQKTPVERRVALKIIKPGMDTQQVIARFEAERQALAMMDHPNIAHVLDAGTTDSGRPFFAMELVKGVPITQYSDEKRLTLKQRLELFADVCHAIQHAHQKGIIHRDIKPSNVLVAEYDDHAVPKIIDFGVAKAIQQQLTEKTMFTQVGQVVGTLEYMSPEQAKLNQLDIDTRSDIYSLGVLLYELLTGETPFDRQRLRSAAFDEMLRILREEEPPKPSTKLSSSETLPSIAANRHVEPRKLSVLVRGELDWIVMKAMEKDRARRYDTANAFASDISNYLNDEAVVACPPSAGYKFRKFARRNTVAFSVATMVMTALMIGIAATTWQAVRAGKAERLAQQRYESEQVSRREAEQQRDRAIAAESLASTEAERANRESDRAKTNLRITTAVINFLTQDLLAKANPREEPDRDIKLRTVLDRASEQIEEQLADQPLVEAAIHSALGSTYLGLGEYDKAEQHYQRALEIRRRVKGEAHSSTMATMHALASTYNKQGRHAESEELFRKVFELRTKVPGSQSMSTQGLLGLANAIHKQGQHAEAERLYRELLKIQQEEFGADHSSTAITKMNLANAINKQGHHVEAEQLYREVLTIQQDVLGPEHPSTLVTTYNLATVLTRQGKNAEAEKLRLELFAIQKRVLGPGHPSTLNTAQNLASSYAEQGRADEAIKEFRSILELQPNNAGTLNNLAWHLTTTEDPNLYDPKEAVTLARKSVELGPEKWERWNTLRRAAFETGNWSECIEAGQKKLEIKGSTGANDRLYMGMCFWHLGDTKKARALYSRAVASMEARIQVANSIPLRDQSEELMGLDLADRKELINAYYSQEFPPDATAQDLIDRGKWFRKQGTDNKAIGDFTAAILLEPENLSAYYNRSVARNFSGEFQSAVEDSSKVIELNPSFAPGYTERAWAHIELGDYDDAIADCDKAIQLKPQAFFAHVRRSWARRMNGQFLEAVRDAKKAIELKPNAHSGYEQLAKAHQELTQWDAARAAYEDMFRIRPMVKTLWSDYAQVLLASGDSAAYRKFCERLLQEHGETQNPEIAWSLIHCCMLGPNAVENWNRIIELSQNVLLDQESLTRRGDVAALLCRAGKWKESLDQRRRVIDESGRDVNAWDCLWLAHTYHGLGKTVEAIDLYKQCLEIAKQDISLRNNLKFQLLRDEVSGLLSSTKTPELKAAQKK